MSEVGLEPTHNMFSFEASVVITFNVVKYKEVFFDAAREIFFH
jgi:hypothetical protein